MNQSHFEPRDLVNITVGTDEEGFRFDHLLAARIPGCSRTQAGRSIRSGAFTVNNTIRKPGFRVTPGDRVTGTLPPAETHPFVPEPVELDIIYSDAACIVLNKPPGLVVHPAPGHSGGTLAHGLIYHFPELESVGSCSERPGIVHRIDKDTSGLLVVARTPEAYQKLISQFKSRTLKKTYLAFVYGDPRDDSGRVTLPIARHRVNRKKMAVGDDNHGRPAETHWKVLMRFGGVSLLEFDIKTGRTHQIRVHSASLGHPVVGDPAYGFRNPMRTFSLKSELTGLIRRHVKRQMLHAARIELAHPLTGQALDFHAPLPEDMAAFQEALQRHLGGDDDGRAGV